MQKEILGSGAKVLLGHHGRSGRIL